MILKDFWFLTQGIPSAWLRICLHVTIIWYKKLIPSFQPHIFSLYSSLLPFSLSLYIHIMAPDLRKVYVVGVGMSKFIKPRGEVDYPGKYYVT